MWDSFEPFQQLNIQDFNFQPSRYEIWKGGQKIDFGNTTKNISVEEKLTTTGSKAILKFKEPGLFSHLGEEHTFDVFLTSNDRLQLIRIPDSGNGEQNMGIKMFQMNVGNTRGFYNFNSNEPYCCNLFILNGQIAKITFSFSSPDKLIEFYNN